MKFWKNTAKFFPKITHRRTQFMYFFVLRTKNLYVLMPLFHFFFIINGQKNSARIIVNKMFIKKEIFERLLILRL